MGAPRFCAHRSFVHQGCHITTHRPRLFSSFVHVIKRNGSWVRLSLGMSNNCLWDSYRYQIWYDWVLLTFLSLFPKFTNLQWKLRNSICHHFIMYQKVRVFKGNRWGLDGGLVRRGCPFFLFSTYWVEAWNEEQKWVTEHYCKGKYNVASFKFKGYIVQSPSFEKVYLSK